jgi:hypothetical protein
MIERFMLASMDGSGHGRVAASEGRNELGPTVQRQSDVESLTKQAAGAFAHEGSVFDFGAKISNCLHEIPRTRGRHHHSTLRVAYLPGQFAIRIPDEDYGSTRREDPIEFARYDQTLERRHQAHEMHVGRGETVIEQFTRLIGQELHIAEPVLCRHAPQGIHVNTPADEQELNLGVRLKRNRRVQEDSIFVCAAQVAGISNDEFLGAADACAQFAFVPTPWAFSLRDGPIFENLDGVAAHASMQQEFLHASTDDHVHAGGMK